MAADEPGFSTSTPNWATERYGDNNGTLSDDLCAGSRYQCPGTGTIEISEIGAYLDGFAETPGQVMFGICTDDGGTPPNPVELVPNSATGEYTPGSSYELVSHTYSTKPQLIGGDYYWLVIFKDGDGENVYLSRFTTGGVSGYKAVTYPTWPTEAQWAAKSETDSAYAIYAVYSAASAQYARPSSDVSDGNWLNEAASNVNLYASIDEETASDVDYIKSGTAPASDTCTVGLGAISTPVSGTTTMRIRAKFL